MTDCIIRGRKRHGYPTSDDATRARGGLADVLPPGTSFYAYHCGRCSQCHVGYAQLSAAAGSQRWKRVQRTSWLAQLIYHLAWTYELNFVGRGAEDAVIEPLSWVEGRRVVLVPVQTEEGEPEPCIVLIDVHDTDVVVAATIDTTSTPPVLIGDGVALAGPAELDRWVAKLETDGLVTIDDATLDQLMTGMDDGL